MATKVRRGIARVNYMAQDRPDLSAVAKTMSQHMSKPHEGVVPLLKRCVKYLKRFPTASLLVPRGLPADVQELVAWTDSDWAGDVDTRRSTSGGAIVYRGATIMHWSKAQSNVALSSAEAELNACVKGLSELLGLFNLVSEVLRIAPSLKLCTDASACRGMLHRHGVGKVKHLSVKQLWSQEVVQCFGVQVDRVPRVDNPADLLTHSVSFPIAESQLARLNMYRDGVGSRRPSQALSLFLLETFCRQPEKVSSAALGNQRAESYFGSASRPCPRLSSMQRARREGGCRKATPNSSINDDAPRTAVSHMPRWHCGSSEQV